VPRVGVVQSHATAGSGVVELHRATADHALPRCSTLRLLGFSVERYKGYAELTRMELAPLTILVGSNNSGKTAVAQAIQLLAGGLTSPEKDNSEPLPLESGGIRHGTTFEDLLTGRSVHGALRLSADLANDSGDLSLSVTVQNVVAPSRRSARQIREWGLTRSNDRIVATREGLEDHSPYLVSISGREEYSQPISWQGLIPKQSDKLSTWVAAQVDALGTWAGGVRHLQCPRSLRTEPFTLADDSPRSLGANGRDTPLALAADDELRESVRRWYRMAFGVDIDVVALGRYFELVAATSTRYANVQLAQSGRGLSHVLPVVVTALTAPKAGPGVDVIEHPEAELHPAAHTQVMELLLANLVGPSRPMVVETHSDMLLLRARRWIAEGKLPADNVLVYWVHTEPGRGSMLRQIRIDENGDMDGWPEGVFIEDYEEIMAIRRAARSDG